MPTYDPTGHPLLSAASARLTSPALRAEAETAETLLGLSGTNLDREAATVAVVYQVNHQVSLGSAGHVVASESRGARSISYRDGDTSISPVARGIVARLVGYPSIAGYR